MSDQSPPVTQPIVTTEQNQLVAQPQAAPVTQTPQNQPEKSAEFAALARKEKALRSRVMELKQKETDLKSREAGLISKERLTREPLAVLAELGIQPHQLAESLLNAPQPLSKAEVELATLRQEIASLRDEKKAEQESSVTQALKQIRVDAELVVNRDPRFELIKATGQVGEVVELIKGVYEKEGTILSLEEASQLVEDQLFEDKFKEIEKLSKLSKLQKRLQPQPAPAPAEPAAAASSSDSSALPQFRNQSMPAKVKVRDELPPRQKIRTLNNSLTSTSRELTSRERAILAFNGKLTG
jgi:hypothetical protein